MLGTCHKRGFSKMTFTFLVKNRPFVEGARGVTSSPPSDNSYKACADVGKAILVFLLLVACSFFSMFLIGLIARSLV